MDYNTNNKAIDIIIYYLNVIKSEELIDAHLAINKSSASYLLKQTVRQLILPREKCYLSVKAKELWDQITDEEIFKYWYRTSVKSKNHNELKAPIYSGASKNPWEIRKLNYGGTIRFREVFHDDHIIPIKLIIDKLLLIDKPNYENVKDILKDISICRMLKEEDRRINEKSKRVYNEREIVVELYRDKYGIKLIDYGYDEVKKN